MRWKAADHPLRGKVTRSGVLWQPEPHWKGTSCGDLSALSEVSRLIAVSLAGTGAVLLLGEIHDNAEHHWLRGRWLETMHEYQSASRESMPGVVFEQLNGLQAPGIAAFTTSRRTLKSHEWLGAFKKSVGWKDQGWSKYHYDDLLGSAIGLEFPIYAGDVPREAMMKAAKEGEAALPVEERTRLALDKPLGAKLDDASLTEIEDAHCNTMPKDALGGMAYAQRYRDATLADALINAAGKHGSAILIAGNGHVRTDRGVPWYIRQRAPDTKVVSVMLVEVEDGKNDPEAYVPRDPEGKPAADYIIFTPRADRGDPCEKMRAKTRQ